MKEDYNEKLLSQFLEKEIQEKGYVDESTIKFAQNRRRHAQINEKYVNDGIKITEEKEQPLASSESDQDYQVQIIEDIDVETDSVPDVPQDDPPSVNKHYEALSSSDEDVPSKESSIKVNDDEVVPDQMPEPQIIVQKPKREKKVSLDKPIMPQIVQDIPRPFQEAPIVLAQAQSDGKIQLNAPALELIKSFSSSLKLVTIIGPRMTGKHLLTNNLAKCPEGSKGFDQENQAGKPRNVQEIRTWGRPTEIGGKSVFFLK